MKALIKDNKVVQVEEQEFPVHNSLVWMDCPEDCKPGWIVQDGQLQPQPEPVLSNEEKILNIEEALNNHINSVARERDYDNAMSIATYVNSTNTDWKAEADAFVAWRDDVWSYAIEQLDLFKSGSRDLVTPDEFINDLPAISWPE